MKKYLIIAFSIGVFLFISLLLVFWFAKYTVISDEKSDDFGNRYGYKVEKYVFWNTTRLTIWSNCLFSCRVYSAYNLTGLTVDEVVEKKWLNHDTAIYLHLKLEYNDSMISVHPAKIIYDFHRGELHTSSSFTLWRFFNDKNKSKDWMKEAEFNSILQKLEQ